MNVRTLLLTTGLAVAIVACGPQRQTAETGEQAEAATASNDAATYVLDGTSSSLVWTGSKPVGDSHTGTIEVSEGTLSVEHDAITAGSFVIDMTTIVNTDIEDSTYNANLVGHLESDDFFGVDAHPTATFEVTNVEAIEGEPDVTHHIMGNFTLKGITHEINIPAVVSIDPSRITTKAIFSIDRSKWNVTFRSGSFFDDLGDKLISDDIALELNLIAYTAGMETAIAQ